MVRVRVPWMQCFLPGGLYSDFTRFAASYYCGVTAAAISSVRDVRGGNEMKRIDSVVLPRSFSLTAVGVFLFMLAAVAAAPITARAQTDEIQVYDAVIAEPGVFNLMWHQNFTPDGIKTPAFPGAIISDHSYNGVPEWAYGVTPWFEQGLYLPVYSVSRGRGSTLDGLKLRELFVRPHADDHEFFYGINFEFSYNALYWEDKRFTSEIRPIVGVHLHQWDLIANPILDTNWTGVKNFEFNPAFRVAYNFNPKWALAAEEYSEYGPLQEFLPGDAQYQSLWAVVDHNTKLVNVETGIGFGLTPGTDKVTLKLMLSRDLNHPKEKQPSNTAQPPQ
jgi:hypothetical protein